METLDRVAIAGAVAAVVFILAMTPSAFGLGRIDEGRGFPGIYGWVTDISTGAAIATADVTVTYSTNTYRGVSKDTGYYYVQTSSGNYDGRTFTVTVRECGYNDGSAVVQVRDQPVRLDFGLVPQDAATRAKCPGAGGFPIVPTIAGLGAGILVFIGTGRVGRKTGGP
jgi:hypothetical protein